MTQKIFKVVLDGTQCNFKHVPQYLPGRESSSVGGLLGV